MIHKNFYVYIYIYLQYTRKYYVIQETIVLIFSFISKNIEVNEKRHIGNEDPFQSFQDIFIY